MSEFKVIVESIEKKIQRIIEVMQHEFGVVKNDTNYLKTKTDSLTVQIALLHEGQTEIKNTLKQKIDREEFAGLEKRVARLESKAA